MIPRLFHRIWVGDALAPGEFEEYGQTWLDHHPGWTMCTWTEGSLPTSVRPEALDRVRHPVERSDILRYELLRLYGGIYVDMDFECVRSIEGLIQGLDFFVAENRPGRVNNAIIGSVPNHPILEAAVRSVRPRSAYGFDKHAAGPLFFNDLLSRFPGAMRFEPGYFYRAGPQAYAIHHSARAWKTREEMNSDIERLKVKLHRARKQLAKAEHKRRKAQTQRDRALGKPRHRAQRAADKEAARAERLSARLGQRESRLAAIERSVWWRLRPWRLLRVARRRRLRGGVGRCGT